MVPVAVRYPHPHLPVPAVYPHPRVPFTRSLPAPSLARTRSVPAPSSARLPVRYPRPRVPAPAQAPAPASSRTRSAPAPSSKDTHGFLCPGCGVLVPVGCPCPLPFGARPMPVPATLRCPPHARARSVGPTRSLLVAVLCSYSSNYSFLGVLLLVGYPYPLCAPTRPLPAPARCSRPSVPVPALCPCSYSSVCSVEHLCPTTRPCTRAMRHAPWRANMSARTAHTANF